MRILITGGNGFIGSHLAEALAERGHEISLLDLLYSKNTERVECEKIIGDVENNETIRKVANDKDVIIHLAAISRVESAECEPENCLRANVIGSLNVARSAIENKSIFILGSSREVYGNPLSVPVKEDDPKNPISVYGVSKLAAEQLTRSYHLTKGLKYIILRFSNVYGSPRDSPERVIPRFISSAANKEPLRVYGGQQVLDFTFIDDVTLGICNLIKKITNRCRSLLNTDFNLVSGEGISIQNLAEMIKSIVNSDSSIIKYRNRRFDVSQFVGDYTKANAKLQYFPEHSLKNGLKTYKARLEADLDSKGAK